PDSVLPDPERLHNAVDTVARQTEDDLDAPSVQRFHENVGRSICHRELPLSERGGCPRNTDVRGGFLRRALPAAAESYCKPTAAPPAGAAARVVAGAHSPSSSIESLTTLPVTSGDWGASAVRSSSVQCAIRMTAAGSPSMSASFTGSSTCNPFMSR